MDQIIGRLMYFLMGFLVGYYVSLAEAHEINIYDHKTKKGYSVIEVIDSCGSKIEQVVNNKRFEDEKLIEALYKTVNSIENCNLTDNEKYDTIEE